jgi:CheY-like chemotaxis protein
LARRLRGNRENWIPVEFNPLYRWHSIVPTSATWGGASVDLAGLRFDNRMLLQDGLVTALAGASQTRAWRIGLFNTAPMLDLVEVASIQQGRDNRLARYNDYRAAMVDDVGHKVFEASSAREALVILRRESGIQLVITDQAMPHMTGLQPIEEMKDDWPDLPVILATGFAELPPGTDLGQITLAKPFRQHDLCVCRGDCNDDP